MLRTALPDDVESLKKLLEAAQDKVATLSARLRSRDVLIEHLKLQLARLRRMKFGRSSEALDEKIAQLELSLEELEANAAAEPQEPTPSVEPLNKPVRKPLPAQLPREQRMHEPASGNCNCPKCGGALRAMGEDVSEVLEYVPEHWKVHRHVRPKYSCGRCETVVQANAPSRPIERSYAGPGLLAHVLVSKYCDHLPLAP
jgi:transposase